MTTDVTIIMSVSGTTEWMGDALQSIIDSNVSTELLIRTNGVHELQKVRRHASLLNRAGAHLCASRHAMLLSTSLNYMLGIASGKYVMRLDPDDVLPPLALEEMVFQLDEGGGYETFVYGDYQDFSDSGWAVRHRCKEATADNLWKHSIGPYNFLARTEFIKQVGWREVGYEDWNMYIRLLSAGGIPLPLDMITLFHRERSDGRGAQFAKAHEARIAAMRCDNMKWFGENR